MFHLRTTELFVSLSKYKEEPEQKVSSSYAKYTLPAQTNKPLEKKEALKLPSSFSFFLSYSCLIQSPLPKSRLLSTLIADHLSC